jgi:hypothetical protein
MLQTVPTRPVRLAGSVFLAFLLFAPFEFSQAAPVPAFKNLRGTYKGSSEIVIEKNNRRRNLSGPVQIKVRLSRSRKVLQVKISGNVLSNNKRGSLSSAYRFTVGGNGRMRLNEAVTPGFVKGSGTANIRKNGGRFTFRSVAYGNRGISSGNLKLRGRTLLLNQNFNSGSSKVSIKYIAPRTGR